MRLNAAWLLSMAAHLVGFVLLDKGDPAGHDPDSVAIEIIDYLPADDLPEPPEPPPLDPPSPEPEPPPPEPTTTKPPPRPPRATPPTDPQPAPAHSQPLALDITLTNTAGSGPSGGGRRNATPRTAAPKSTPNTSQPKPQPACSDPPTKPKPVAKVEFQYPPAARERGQEGRVVLKAVVDERGHVTGVDVLGSAGELIDVAAAKTLRQWLFEPATACGRPVTGTYKLARVFELGG